MNERYIYIYLKYVFALFLKIVEIKVEKYVTYPHSGSVVRLSRHILADDGAV